MKNKQCLSVLSLFLFLLFLLCFFLFLVFVLLFIPSLVIVFLAEIVLFILSEQLFYILKIISFLLLLLFLFFYIDFLLCNLSQNTDNERSEKIKYTSPFYFFKLLGKILETMYFKARFTFTFEVERNCMYVWEYIKYGN